MGFDESKIDISFGLSGDDDDDDEDATEALDALLCLKRSMEGCRAEVDIERIKLMSQREKKTRDLTSLT